MKLLVPALLALLLAACEDVDRYATPTPVPFAGVVMASTDQRVGEGVVPTAVAGVSARREQRGGVTVDVVTPSAAAAGARRTVVIDLSRLGAPPAGTPVPTAVAGIVERR